MTTLWTDRIAMGARDLRSSAIRDLLQLTAQPDMISLMSCSPGTCRGSGRSTTSGATLCLPPWSVNCPRR